MLPKNLENIMKIIEFSYSDILSYVIENENDIELLREKLEKNIDTAKDKLNYRILSTQTLEISDEILNIKYEKFYIDQIKPDFIIDENLKIIEKPKYLKSFKKKLLFKQSIK